SSQRSSMMLDTDDSDSVSPSSSTAQSDNAGVYGREEVQLNKESLLDQCLDGLYEKRSISYFSTPLDKDDRSIRIATGEALALIFYMGNLDKFSSDGSINREFAHIQGLRGKILNEVRNLATEAGSKGSTKKDLNSQRNSFRGILEFLVYGYPPETSVKISGESIKTTSWSQLIQVPAFPFYQLNFLRHFLGGGFVKHIQDNEFLHDVFGFKPKRKQLPGDEHHISIIDNCRIKTPGTSLSVLVTRSEVLSA
ncbi:hypothetical protein U1Q18_005511, partial [Sarracenia purpurea var. burkii]